MSPQNLNFGNVVYMNSGATSAPKSVTVKNTHTGAGTVVFQSTSITGNFAIVSNACTGTLAPGASCQVTMTFTPTALGTQTGTLTFVDNASNSPQVVNLNGTGVAGKVRKSSAKLLFGTRAIDTTNTVRTLTLSNPNTVGMHIDSAAISGQYAIKNDTCSGTDLAPSGSCTISVAFMPTTTGLLGGGLSVADNAAGSPQPIDLSGTSVILTALRSPLKLGFGRQQIDTTSAAKTLKLTNPNLIGLQFDSAVASSDYVIQSDTCSGNTIPPSGTCKITVAFAPTKLGTDYGTLTIATNATYSPQLVKVSGSGVLIDPTYSTRALGFWKVPVGTTSDPMSVTLTNPNLVAMHFNNASISGDFAIESDTCSGTDLAPSSSCAISVTFTPTQTGTRAGKLTISDNAETPTQNVSLGGTGQ